MNVWRSGTRLWERDSARTWSRPGVRSSSTATLIEHLVGIGEAEPASGQEHGQVVENVGGLLGQSLVGLVPRGARHLLGLLLDLLLSPGRIREQRGGIALVRVGGAALVDGALAGVASRPGRFHERDEGVVVAVVAQRLEALDVSGRLALVPQLAARSRPEPHLAAGPGALERLLVHVREGQDFAGARVLNAARSHFHAFDYGRVDPAGSFRNS